MSPTKVSLAEPHEIACMRSTYLEDSGMSINCSYALKVQLKREWKEPQNFEYVVTPQQTEAFTTNI